MVEEQQIVQFNCSSVEREPGVDEKSSQLRGLAELGCHLLGCVMWKEK